MVAWWSWVEGEMRSSKIDSDMGEGDLGEDEEALASSGADSRSGESGGGTGSVMRR